MHRSSITSIKRVGVAGCGTMGTGIAIVAVRAGFDTVVYDKDEAALLRLRQQSLAFFEKSVRLGKLTSEQADHAMTLLSTTANVENLGPCDIIIEAVFENLATKQELFRQLHASCQPQAIFASNTSTLSITELASSSGRANLFVGMHFCLPAQLMKLVEMSPGLQTDERAFRVAWEFCKALGQLPVKTQDSPGFILNYFLIPYNNDAVRLVEAGVAEPAEIDRAVKTALGYPLGPCELIDLIGLDTQLYLCDVLHSLTNEPRAACPALIKRMVAAGRLGRKSGRGFYDYDKNPIFGA